MSQTQNLMAARLQRDVPTAEARVDDAIIALSSLMTSMVTARRETGAPRRTGQVAIMRLAKAQMSLVNVSNDVLRVHDELAGIGKEMGSYDLRDCPAVAQATASHLTLAA
jgi:hypothetical protein